MELIKDQHKSPALLRYADRITVNRFDSKGGFNLAGGIADARWVSFSLLSSFLPPSWVFPTPSVIFYRGTCEVTTLTAVSYLVRSLLPLLIRSPGVAFSAP